MVSANRNKANVHAVSTLSNLIAELYLCTMWHTAYGQFARYSQQVKPDNQMANWLGMFDQRVKPVSWQSISQVTKIRQLVAHVLKTELKFSLINEDLVVK